MNKNKGKDLAGLVKLGRKKEEDVVGGEKTENIIIPDDFQQAAPVANNIIPSVGIDYFFNENIAKGTELVRIPADQHMRIKTLATIKKSSIGIIIANMIEKELNSNKSEIDRIIRNSTKG